MWESTSSPADRSCSGSAWRHRAQLPTLVVKRLLFGPLLRIPTDVFVVVPSFHRLERGEVDVCSAGPQTGDQCLIPGRRCSRAASTSEAPTSGFRSSCTSGAWAGISTSGSASSPTTASSCSASATQTGGCLTSLASTFHFNQARP